MSEEWVKQLQTELSWIRQFIHKDGDGVVIRDASGVDISKWLDRTDAALAAQQTQQEAAVKELHFVLDGPPSHESGRFVEVEDENGKSVNVGRWEQRGNYWHLIVTAPPTGVREGDAELLAALRKAANLENVTPQLLVSVIRGEYQAATLRPEAERVEQGQVMVPGDLVSDLIEYFSQPNDTAAAWTFTDKRCKEIADKLRAAQEGKK